MSVAVHGRRVARSNRHWAFVFAGGATGALARAVFEKALPTGAGAFPWSTLAINAIGTFVLGWSATRLTQHPSPRERAFLIAGFCGGLTTFATMQLELVKLLDHGDGRLALGYAAASVVAGFATARVAVTLATRSAIAS
jgi:CrcB protein